MSNEQPKEAIISYQRSYHTQGVTEPQALTRAMDFSYDHPSRTGRHAFSGAGTRMGSVNALRYWITVANL